MSLALHLAADAQADLRRLEPWLQEDVLDELDRLVADPGRIPPPLAGWGRVYTFARASGGSLHVVALTLDWRIAKQSLTVLGVQLVSAAGP